MMTTWLKKARRLSGLSAQELADACGFSLNYIQRMENGDRDFSEHAKDIICTYLGFSPEDISLDFDKLMSDIDKLIEQDGETSFCLVRYIRRRGHVIPIDFSHWNGLQADIALEREHPNISNVQTTPLQLRYAKEEIIALRNIYDYPILESDNRTMSSATN